MNKLKLLVCAAAAMSFCGVYAADTDCGALITTGNIADSAKVENLTGANAGKATITINNNSGTANAVTVYNASTIDTALSGKASTGDVTALQNRATALETATNNLTTAVGNALEAAKGYTDEQCGMVQDALSTATGTMTLRINNAAAAATNYTNSAYVNATNNAAQTYVKKAGDTMSGNLIIGKGNYLEIRVDDDNEGYYSTKYYGSLVDLRGVPGGGFVRFPTRGDGELAFLSDISSSFDYTAITNAPWLLSTAISSWALAATKPSYNFSEIGTKPTTLSGYGIADAKIENGTITLGSATITPLTSYTESDPVWTAEKSGYVPTSRKIAGKALTSDVTLSNLSIVGSSTTTYNGSATASVNQTTQTQTSTTQGGTTGKNLTIQVAATSLDMGAYYIKIGSDGKPHLMLRQ